MGLRERCTCRASEGISKAEKDNVVYGDRCVGLDNERRVIPTGTVREERGDGACIWREGVIGDGPMDMQ